MAVVVIIVLGLYYLCIIMVKPLASKTRNNWICSASLSRRGCYIASACLRSSGTVKVVDHWPAIDMALAEECEKLP